MLRSRRRVSRTETTSSLRVTGFSTRSSRSGLARVSRLLSLAVGLWKEIVLLWLVGLGVIQALVGPVSRGGDGGVELSVGRKSCVMACRGSSRVLGVLGITRPARYAGAFASFLPSRIRHPHRGVDWYSGLRARSTNRSRVASTAGALEASKTPASARSSGSATKISNRKSGGTKARARATTAKKTSPSSSTGANISADSRSGSIDCSPRKVLVIVESPAKARTISGILEKARNIDGSSMNFGGYTVDACNGHVRDLVGKRKDVPPELKERTKKWDVIGVDVENSFEPLYIPNPAKKAIVNRLKKAASKSDEIILATDEDREGEAISWHLLQVLQPTVPVKRAVFHEITQEALTKAFENPGEIDHNLVQAQEARRILDRLAGFTLTPVVWSLVAPGLSAGRVQSVALAMVVERERKRLLFKPAEYWDVVANVTAAAPTAAGRAGSSGSSGSSSPFEARLVRVGSKTVVSSKDFDPDTGELKKKLDASSLEILEPDKAAAVAAAAAAVPSLSVLSVDKRRVKRKPPPPFITSTLQQEASRKLGLRVSQTMRTAQALYEAGYITYMRTDRPVLSDTAAGVAERAVRDVFGAEYVRQGKATITKVKGSQEAHEAIRPALLSSASLSGSLSGGDGDGEGEGTAEAEGGVGAKVETVRGEFLHPSDLPAEGLEPQQRALYELVYRRTLASAMAESEADFTTVLMRASDIVLGREGEQDLEFKATGKTTVFDGFLKAYEEGREGDSDSGDEADDHRELPRLERGSEVFCENARPAGHRTSPPRRYSEASFVKELEAQGVGRPSTYANILETLRNRAYVNMQGRSLRPSLTGFVVADLLRQHFPDFTDIGFTAQMENKLDEIARGKKGRVEYLSEYYLGDDGLKATVDRKRRAIDPLEAKRARLPGLESLDDRCAIFVGPYGGYLVPEREKKASEHREDEYAIAAAAMEGGKEKTGVKDKSVASAVTLPYIAQENLELLTPELVERCLDSTYKGGDILGQHPDTGEDVRVRMGRYGPYLECGNITRPAIPHASTAAGRKDPTDLSLPPPPPLSRSPRAPPPASSALPENPPLQPSAGLPQGVGRQANLHFSPSFPVGNTNVSSADLTQDLPQLAEDVIAFGVGLGGKNIAANTSDGVSLCRNGEAEAGAWYSAVSLERAVGLLSLPRIICDSHPAEGGPIEVGIGRYGVYVKHRELYKMVPKGIDVLDVDEALAVDLVDEVIQRNKERPTVELGIWQGEKVLVKHGRWGRFVYCDGTQANLPAKYKSTLQGEGHLEVSLEEAIQVIEAKRAKATPARDVNSASASRKGGRSPASGKKNLGTGSKRHRLSSAKANKEDGGERVVGIAARRRPLSGFFRFCQDCREEHAKGSSGDAVATSATSRLRVQELSERWKSLPQEVREQHNVAAAAAMEEWKAETTRGENIAVK